MVDLKVLARPRFAAQIEPTEGCWLWKGHVDPDGYGYAHVTVAGKKIRSAHRAMYTLMFGPVPKGLVIHHTCGTRACVNPDHLEAVTIRDNVLRSGSFIARNAQKEQCAQGHPFDLVNTYVAPDGERMCRICRRAATARRDQKRREARVGN